MLRYRKGKQADKLDDLPTLKIDLVMNGDTEGIWVKQGADYVVLQNTAVCFYPFPSWGTVFPSQNPPGDRRETVDVSHLTPSDGLELHPEAWEQYRERNTIDPDGNFIIPQEKEKEEEESTDVV